MEPSQFTLQNGLRIILVDTKVFPSMTAILLFGAGSRYEEKKNNGIAHFFEHMPFKGSKKYPSFFKISSLLEGLGAYHNAFTSKDHTGYWVKSPVSHFEKVIDVIADITLHPLLDEKEIEREKHVIVEEINMYEDTPMRRVGEYLEQLLYQGNPLGFDTIGTKENILSFNRSVFTDYMKRFYHPDNAILVVAGGLSQNKAQNSKNRQYLEIIETKFTSWKGKTEATFSKLEEHQTYPQMRIMTKKTEQTHFCLGFAAFSFFDKRKNALSVLSAVLGGGSSSRLFIEVRERRGLCYYISTGRELYHDVGYVVTQAGVSNDKAKIHEAISVILSEQDKIAKGDLSKEELRRAKEILKGRFLLSLEDSSNVASFFGTKLLLERHLKTPKEIVDGIEAVTEGEVVSLAKELLDRKKMNLALVGPFKDSDFSDILKS